MSWRPGHTGDTPGRRQRKQFPTSVNCHEKITPEEAMEFLHQTSKYTFLVGTTPVTISNDFGETAHTRARIQVEFENYAYEDPENFGRWRHQEVSRIYEILAPAENTRQASKELEDQIDCGPPYDDPVTITGAIDGKTFHATGYMSGYKNGWQLSIRCESKDFHILDN